jgi:hypothetical protein
MISCVHFNGEELYHWYRAHAFFSLPQDEVARKGGMEAFKRMFDEIDEADEVCFLLF